jgi:hypothetical protein
MAQEIVTVVTGAARRLAASSETARPFPGSGTKR